MAWTTNADGVCEPSLEWSAGLLPAMAGMPLAAWVAAVATGDNNALARQTESALARQQPFELELDIVCGDGQLRHALMTGLPRPHGAGFSGALTDITAQRHALDAAQRSAATLRLMVDNTTDLMAFCDTEGRYIDISSSFTRTLGWTADQLIGQPAITFVHPDDHARCNAELALVFGGETRPDAMELRKRRIDGGWVTLGSKTSMVTDPATGACLGAVFVSRDITREKDILHRLERMAEQNVALIDNSPDIMMLLDLQGTILNVNEAVGPVLGYGVAGLVRQARIEELTVEADAGVIRAALAASRQDGDAEATVSCRRNDGRIVQLAWSMRHPAGSGAIYATARDVTENHLARLDLQKSHEQVRTLLESIDDGFFSVNADWEIVYANTRAAAFVGVERDAAIGRVVWDVAHGLAESSVGGHLRAAMASRENASFEAFYAPVGVWVTERIYAHEDGLSVFFHDISDRVTRERQIRESERRFRETVGITPAGYVLVNGDGIVEDVNPALCQLSGHAREDLVGAPVASILADGDASNALNIRQTGQPVHALETVLIHRLGHRVVALVNQTIELDAAGRPCSLTAFITDITERKHAEARLEELATRDSLTGLPNRAWINRRVGDMLDQPRSATSTTVFFIDLNRFKEVNDSMGHATGDRLLQQVGQRLQLCMRPGDVVARLGGDEFVVAASCAGRDAAAVIAERLLGALKTPFHADGLEMRVGASIGISLASPGAASTELLFQHADTAMYQAKALGNGSFQFFEPEMCIAAKRRLQLEVSLHRALDQGQFEVHYQPRVDLRSLRLLGVEALLRWNHPEFGRVPPLEFIPLAEERGHIGAIGQWVLGVACRDVKQLNDRLGLALHV
ncbi:MAG TPA: PAS domain S-box protein, partial [Pseudoduganella sp.]